MYHSDVTHQIPLTHRLCITPSLQAFGVDDIWVGSRILFISTIQYFSLCNVSSSQLKKKLFPFTDLSQLISAHWLVKWRHFSDKQNNENFESSHSIVTYSQILCFINISVCSIRKHCQFSREISWRNPLTCMSFSFSDIMQSAPPCFHLGNQCKDFFVWRYKQDLAFNRLFSSRYFVTVGGNETQIVQLKFRFLRKTLKRIYTSYSLILAFVISLTMVQKWFKIKGEYCL